MGSSLELAASSGGVCRYQPDCPGCPHFGKEGIASAPAQALTELARRAGALPPEFVVTPGLGSRHRVRLSVRQTGTGLGLGIFRARSHELVSIVDCPLHHPSIVSVTRVLQRQLEERAISGYVEPPRPGIRGRGLVRAVQLAVERPTERIQLVVVVNAEPGEDSGELSALRQVLATLTAQPLVVGTFLNYQPQPTNTLLGRSFEYVAGELVLRDRSGGAQVFYPPGAFGQANPSAHDRAVEEIHRKVGDRSVMEFYAGVGTIGLGLAARGNSVRFNEIAGGSLEGLALGIAELGPDAQVSVLSGPAEQHAGQVQELSPGGVVVVDPPRKGLAPQLLDELCAREGVDLVYLSCGLASLLRESERLLQAGYRLLSLKAFSYFPYTEHVETLAHFGARG